MNLLTPSEIASLSRREQARYLKWLERLHFALEREALSDLASFSKAAWKVLEPSTELIWNWHLDLLCEHLTLARDRKIRRLIINEPPQTSKSRFATIFYPAWTWITEPSRRFMCVSYSGGATGLSTLHSTERRRLLESSWFQELWPGRVVFAPDQNQKQQYENAAGGRMIATSTGGSATGKGIHDLILDDLLNPQQAESDAERGSALEFLDGTLRSRLSDQMTGVIIIVEQRTHEEDVTGHVMKQEPGIWTRINLPMEAIEDERWVFPLSGKVVERKRGELLWSARFPEVVCHSLKITLGSRKYDAQYQQTPSPPGGSIIKRQWIRYWTRDPRKCPPMRLAPEQFDELVVSWDMAFKDTPGASKVAGQVWGRAGTRKLLLAARSDHMDYVQTEKAVLAMHNDWPTATTLVEDKANGPAIIARLKDKVPRLIAVQPEGSKEARMYAVSADWEAGNVEVPDPDMPGYEWVRDWVDSICRFPAKPNDDGDAASQALQRLYQIPLEAASPISEEEREEEETGRFGRCIDIECPESMRPPWNWGKDWM